jgi:multidrug resistance efflux pump
MSQSDFDIRSDEVQEILGTPPGWLVRWGSTAVLLILLALAWVAWLVRYPELVVSPITLSTINPPVPVFVQSDGYIDGFLYSEGDTVQKGALLAVINNAARYEDVLRLERELETLHHFDREAMMAYAPNPSLRLGSIQSEYQPFVLQYQELIFPTRVKERDRSQLRALQERIVGLKNKHQGLEQQLRDANEELEQRSLQFNLLHHSVAQNNSSSDELDLARQELIGQARRIDSLQTEEARVARELTQRNMELISLGASSASAMRAQLQRLQRQMSLLEAAIQSWKRRYLLLAPVEGTLSFFTIRTGPQYLRSGDEVLAVLPFQHDQTLVAEVLLPVAGSGKVERGQKVLIKFDSYPYTEFGLVEGRVQEKAQLAQNDTYSVRVSLNQGLRTSYGRELSFRQGMSGSAEIITAEKRFLQRLLDIFSFVDRY